MQFGIGSTVREFTNTVKETWPTNTNMIIICILLSNTMIVDRFLCFV